MREYEIHCRVRGSASGTIRAKNKKEALKLAKQNLEFAEAKWCGGFDNNKYCEKCKRKVNNYLYKVCDYPEDCPYYLEQVIDEK